MLVDADRHLPSFRAPLVLDEDAELPSVLTVDVLNGYCDHGALHFHLVPIFEGNDLLILVPGDFWVRISRDDASQAQSLF